VIFKPFLMKVEMAIGEVNAHLIGCGATKEVMLVDAGSLDDAIVEFVEENGLKLAAVFITHDHPDHVDGLPDVVARYQPKVYAPVERPGGVAAIQVAHGDEVAVGRLRGRVVETSGHTPIGLSLVFPGMVFSGDALFAGSVGGTGTKEAYEKQIGQIREHLFTLPGDHEVYSGHGPGTTIAIERDYNPFFR
jgi:hydroxyacylglutathione hydrolase